jgi:hypothetical protein
MADISLTAEKIRKNALVTGSFRYDFTESQVASVSVKIAASWSLDQVTGRIFKISK